MRKLNYNKTRPNHILTDEQLDFIKQNWLLLSDESMAKELQTTRNAVRKLRMKLGLNRQLVVKSLKEVPLVVLLPRDSYREFLTLSKRIGATPLSTTTNTSTKYSSNY